MIFFFLSWYAMCKRCTHNTVDVLHQGTFSTAINFISTDSHGVDDGHVTIYICLNTVFIGLYRMKNLTEMNLLKLKSIKMKS